MLSLLTLGGLFFGFSTEASIISSKKSTYSECYNYSQCANDSIDTSYAACYGYYGCSRADITSSYTLAYGELAAYKASIESKYTYTYGHYGGYGASIATYRLYSYGYHGARVADIEPYDEELEVYNYGYYAGYGSDISCYSGDTCSIYCGCSEGCYGVNLYCYSGATCYYDCSCDDTCPTTYAGVESDLTYVTKYGTATISGGVSNLGGDGDDGADDTPDDDENLDADGSNGKGNDKENKNNKKQSIDSEIVLIYTDLTDAEIREFKTENELMKDLSQEALELSIRKDTTIQMHMTQEQEYWEYAAFRQQAEEEQEKRAEKEKKQNNKNNNNEEDISNLVVYPDIPSMRNYKHNKNHHDNNNAFFWGISLKEYGIALFVDICIFALFMHAKSGNYCTKKGYQQI